MKNFPIRQALLASVALLPLSAALPSFAANYCPTIYSKGALPLKIMPGFVHVDSYAEGDGRNQYDSALTAIRTALETRDIDGDGRPDRLEPAGIIWMQGEADAHQRADAAAAYRVNLDHLMGLLRAALRVDGLPVVIGRIAESGAGPNGLLMTYSPQVQQAQADWVAADRCAALVSVTKDFKFLPDHWHYLSTNYVTLGAAFADAALALQARCGP